MLPRERLQAPARFLPAPRGDAAPPERGSPFPHRPLELWRFGVWDPWGALVTLRAERRLLRHSHV